MNYNLSRTTLFLFLFLFCVKEIPVTVGEQLIEKGRQKGKQEGRREEKLEVARKALAKGMSPADVAELTDLPLEVIQKLSH